MVSTVKGVALMGCSLAPGYASDRRYFGALVGRVANRIAGGRFVVDGVEYQLAVTNGPNALHGGLRGFNKVCSTTPRCRSVLSFTKDWVASLLATLPASLSSVIC